ncbi:thioredoxin [Paenibacillus sp. JNUCC31]|uniref:thioredoxin family protein n=1 Tax=Paenibacillus sp. JNUCC-31 TaxID=2777983 RepID=UPI0017809B81|nr:thioredoxin domain-containing protein [Paenibacillus sp. JNUCC-31]QOS77009.1 thioredoxin [Paenibacillus sp. JNUCC-31]
MAITEYNPETYVEMIKEGFTIVDFYGERCGPCDYLSNVLDELVYELPFLDIIKVNTTVEQELAEKNNIRGVPVIYFYKDGEVVKDHVGSIGLAQIKELISEIMY